MIEDYDRLTDAEKTLITALPYRVGLWMSTLEGEGGDIADELESMAMIEAIEEIAKSPYYDFAAYICRQTLAQKNRWLGWSSDFSSVPDECKRAIGMLARLIPEEDLLHYREALFLVAASVARAYREEGNAGSGGARSVADLPGMVNQLIGRLFDAVGSYENQQNVSVAEAGALRNLVGYLGLEHIPRKIHG